MSQIHIIKPENLKYFSNCGFFYTIDECVKNEIYDSENEQMYINKKIDKIVLFIDSENRIQTYFYYNIETKSYFYHSDNINELHTHDLIYMLLYIQYNIHEIQFIELLNIDQFRNWCKYYGFNIYCPLDEIKKQFKKYFGE